MYYDKKFYAKPSQLVYGVPLSAKRNVPDTVKDFIFQFGAPTAFLSISAAENKGYKIEDVERNYNISRHHYSEPEYQNQNWVENKLVTLRIWLIISWILWVPRPLAG